MIRNNRAPGEDVSFPYTSVRGSRNCAHVVFNATSARPEESIAMTQTPWAMLLCKFSDNDSEPYTRPLYDSQQDRNPADALSKPILRESYVSDYEIR